MANRNPIKTKPEKIIYKQKTYNVRKLPRHSIARQKTKNTIVCSVLTTYCWAWPLRVVFIPSESPLEETKFSFEWLSIGDIFWFRAVSSCSLPLSSLELHLFQTHADPVCYHGLCEFTYPLALLCLEGLIYIVCSILSVSYNLSTSSAGFLGP